jgi:hypothetical protein
MFCNQCGTPVQSDYNLCPKCGQPLNRVIPPPPITHRLERHLHILGILWIIIGVLFLIPSLLMMSAGGLAHMFIPGEAMVAHVLGPFMLFLFGGTLLILGVGGILVGRGLMQHSPWARVAALILGVLALFHPPFGTALGIYTLWVLLSEDAGQQYERMARTA